MRQCGLPAAAPGPGNRPASRLAVCAGQTVVFQRPTLAEHISHVVADGPHPGAEEVVLLHVERADVGKEVGLDIALEQFDVDNAAPGSHVDRIRLARDDTLRRKRLR